MGKQRRGLAWKIGGSAEEEERRRRKRGKRWGRRRRRARRRGRRRRRRGRRNIADYPMPFLKPAELEEPARTLAQIEMLILRSELLNQNFQERAPGLCIFNKFPCDSLR